MCDFIYNTHSLPCCKYVLKCCANYPSDFIHGLDSTSAETEIHPKISVHLYIFASNSKVH